eukprot:CAMPEP_0195150894 /NCGR_PEP_ID=MMETSP0448-20130528/179660_1 /TAXON_ID=66468 /ORGANISM="Heterocapsa triquestra, Strain CCMP 448" /LENGTH=81 /DNA_ID=CAMNT_0040189593 /DNA_START=51 /DNA_END=292 /DNA_ORIENTATION=-
MVVARSTTTCWHSGRVTVKVMVCCSFAAVAIARGVIAALIEVMDQRPNDEDSLDTTMAHGYLSKTPKTPLHAIKEEPDLEA